MLAFFGGAGAALLVDGVWAFYLYQLIYFLNPADRWWGSSLPSWSFSFIAVAFIFGGLLLRYRETSDLARFGDQPVAKWVLAILLMYVFMYIHALSPAHHKQAIIDFSKLVIVVAMGYKLINTEKKLDLAIWAYVIGATYIGYVATSTGRNRGDRLEGIGTVDSPDANGTAAIIAPALMFCLYYVWLGKKKYIKAAAVVCGALVANGIVLINSRGAFVAVVAGAAMFVFFMLFSRFQRASQRSMAIFLIIAGLGGVVYVTDEAFWERMGTLKEVDDDEGDRGGAHRVDFWLATFDIMADYPWGVGVRGYNMVSANYIDPSLTRGGEANKSVHSSWFQSLGELGWPGPILFLGMLYSCYRISRRTKQHLIAQNRIDEYFKMLAIEAALVCFLAAATFINRFRAEILYWLIMFLACATNVYYLQTRGREKAADQLDSPATEKERLSTP